MTSRNRYQGCQLVVLSVSVLWLVVVVTIGVTLGWHILLAFLATAFVVGFVVASIAALR